MINREETSGGKKERGSAKSKIGMYDDNYSSIKRAKANGKLDTCKTLLKENSTYLRHDTISYANKFLPLFFLVLS